MGQYRQSKSRRSSWPYSATVTVVISITTMALGASQTGLLALQSLIGSAADPIRTAMVACSMLMIVVLPLAVRHLGRRDATSIALSNGLLPEDRAVVAVESVRRLRTICRTALGFAVVLCATFLAGLIVEALSKDRLEAFHSKWRVADNTFGTIFPLRSAVTGEVAEELRAKARSNLEEYDYLIATYGGTISPGERAKLLGKKALLQIMLGDRAGARDTTHVVDDLGPAGEKVHAFLVAYLYVQDPHNQQPKLPPTIAGSLALATPYARVMQAERLVRDNRDEEALPILSSFVDEFRESAKLDATISGQWADASAIKLAALNNLGRAPEALKLSDEVLAHCRKQLISAIR